jgi:hypothetical protein
MLTRLVHFAAIGKEKKKGTRQIQDKLDHACPF